MSETLDERQSFGLTERQAELAHRHCSSGGRHSAWDFRRTSSTKNLADKPLSIVSFVKHLADAQAECFRVLTNALYDILGTSLSRPNLI